MALTYLKSLLFISPINYGWLIPDVPNDPEDTLIDRLAREGKFPVISDLAPALGHAVFFGLARLVLTYLIFKPMAIRCMKLKISEEKRQPALDGLISMHLPLSNNAIVAAYCAGSGQSESEVNRYLWTRRRNESIKKKIVKFVEALWRLIFYSVFCVIGFQALFKRGPQGGPQEWIYDTSRHWHDWPKQPVDDFITFYYQVELGSYVHQLMWTEVSRSDATEMILHHLTTILLIGMSFLTSFTRIGSSILLVHDWADIFLESGKCFNYVSKAKGNKWACNVCDTLFGLFAFFFFVTRLVIYPRFLLYSLLVEAPSQLNMWSGYWAFALLLLVLQCLHIFWFCLIVRMIFKLLKDGGVEKDERSDEEEVFDEEYSEKIPLQKQVAEKPHKKENKKTK